MHSKDSSHLPAWILFGKLFFPSCLHSKDSSEKNNLPNKIHAGRQVDVRDATHVTSFCWGKSSGLLAVAKGSMAMGPCSLS
jgi:hypothetical protein